MAVTYIQGIPCISVGGVLRKLAALVPTAADKAYFKTKLFISRKTVDPSQWKECDLSTFGSPIRDQGQHGSCTGHAGVAALDIVRRQENQSPVLLSCTFPYSLVNGGRDQGASVSSILRVLEQYGTCTAEECGTNQIFKNQYPQSAFDTAKNYKAVEALTCNTFEEICEAVNSGFPTAFGIQVGQNFSRLSSEGVCPPPNMTVGGHALCGIGLKKSSTGDWLLKFQNSWGASWGLRGYAYLSRGSFDNMVDAYAIMYAENANGPPVATETLTITVLPTTEVTPANELQPVLEEIRITEAEGSSSVVHTDPDSLLPLRKKDSFSAKPRRK